LSRWPAGTPPARSTISGQRAGEPRRCRAPLPPGDLDERAGGPGAVAANGAVRQDPQDGDERGRRSRRWGAPSHARPGRAAAAPAGRAPQRGRTVSSPSMYAPWTGRTVMDVAAAAGTSSRGSRLLGLGDGDLEASDRLRVLGADGDDRVARRPRTRSATPPRRGSRSSMSARATTSRIRFVAVRDDVAHAGAGGRDAGGRSGVPLSAVAPRRRPGGRDAQLRGGVRGAVLSGPRLSPSNAPDATAASRSVGSTPRTRP
jgi:hypothetical protein